MNRRRQIPARDKRDRGFASFFLHRRVRELSVPPETKSNQDAKPRHSIPRKQSLISRLPRMPHLPRRLVRVRKSAAFASVLDGDGHWVEYNDPVFGERMPEATAGGPVRREGGHSRSTWVDGPAHRERPAR